MFLIAKLISFKETDELLGSDPYSASKAASELAVSSWRDSFCGLEPHQTSFISVASARAGNVIGGGDWAEDRIVPDSMRALAAGEPIPEEIIQEGLTALTRLYAVKFQLGERWEPFTPNNTVPATAAMIMCTAMLRGVNVEVFELGMWQSWSGA